MSISVPVVERPAPAAEFPAKTAERRIEKVVIGPATLYRADCFDVLPELSGLDALITDPPYGVRLMYFSSA